MFSSGLFLHQISQTNCSHFLIGTTEFVAPVSNPLHCVISWLSTHDAILKPMQGHMCEFWRMHSVLAVIFKVCMVELQMVFVQDGGIK